MKMITELRRPKRNTSTTVVMVEIDGYRTGVSRPEDLRWLAQVFVRMAGEAEQQAHIH
jgi:hypothetical protein